MMHKTIALGLTAFSLSVHAETTDRFIVDAVYRNASLASLSFDYRDGRQPGFSADDLRVPGSACYAKIPGSDNLSTYLNTIKNKPLYQEIEETRQRMREAVSKNKLDVWQEVLCVGQIPYRATSNSNGGKWSSVSIMLNGQRQGAWNDVFTVARPSHIYSITVHPSAIKP